MRAPFEVRLVLVMTALVSTMVAAAQSRRDPTVDEAKVLTRFYSAITSVIGPFADENWEVSGGTLPEDASHESISVRPRVPLDDCIGGDRAWTVRNGSPRFNARLKPLYDRAQTLAGALLAKYQAGADATADKNEIDRVHQQIKSEREVTMNVCGNSPNVEAAALAPGAPSLLPGVAAHKLTPDACGDSATACYVLVYGDWQSARASGARYDFHFAHPAASPYLENIVIRLHGADDRVQEMLKADWARVGAALGGPKSSQ
jgi:hypothetical protein